jgi:hypothetical protein
LYKIIAFAVLFSLPTVFSPKLAHAEPCPRGAHLDQHILKRKILVEKMRGFMGGGSSSQAIVVGQRIAELDTKMPFIWLKQEIQNFPLFGNVGCLVAAMRRVSGQDLNYQPYSDQTYDLLLGGKTIRSRIPASELLSIARSLR